MTTGPINRYTCACTITQMFEQSVLSHPDNIAVYLDKDHVTYKQFNDEANQCARYLRDKGVTRNTVVCVSMKRSYEMLRTIFAVLKAGGTYLPLSPDYPKERKETIIKEAKADFFIVDSTYSYLPSDLCKTLTLPDANIKHQGKGNLPSTNHPDDTAYVIYTSGSTGTPKGVMIAHTSLVNRITWMQDLFPIGCRDVLFQKTHSGFDVSIWELFWWSISGASLALLPHGKEDNFILIANMIFEKQVTVIHFVPTVLKIFLEYLHASNNTFKINSLKFAFCSGEALDVQTVSQFNKLFHASDYPQLINLYGPTEATIDVTYFVCDKKSQLSEIPIGKPIYNAELMVLDESLKPSPTNTIGELYISGVCLAKGYLNNPEQTRASFLKSPFDKNTIIYKTGDLVKWNEHSELCYIGRKDQQVKINGIRIEPGEIEHHLQSYNNISHAVTLCITNDSSSKKLVAFISLRDKSTAIEFPALQSFLQDKLPNYMLPHDYVVVEKYPIKDSGKLDRKKLASLYQSSCTLER